ncbi:hypothetical protein KM043_000268 [Ampulex compressa]|nr:hypothetical protein KM043_000268 [Ampulex compressa]
MGIYIRYFHRGSNASGSGCLAITLGQPARTIENSSASLRSIQDGEAKPGERFDPAIASRSLRRQEERKRRRKEGRMALALWEGSAEDKARNERLGLREEGAPRVVTSYGSRHAKVDVPLSRIGKSSLAGCPP